MDGAGVSSGAAAPSRARSRLADYGFYVALAIAAFLFYRTIREILIPVLVGAFAAVLARPTDERLNERLGGRRRLAASLTTIGVLGLVVVPAAALGWLIVQNLAEVAAGAAQRLAEDGLDGILAALPLPRRVRASISHEQLGRIAEALLGKLGGLAGALVTSAVGFAASTFIFVISLYYFLLDGHRWMAAAVRLAPIEPRYLRAFAEEFVNVSRAILYGSLVTAIVQGGVALVGYLVFSVPQALLWGAATGVMSLTPIIGTTSIWLPVAIGMFVGGHALEAIGVLLWGALVIGSVDNVLRPFLMRGRMRLHPLVVFLSVIGGVAAFGVAGLFLGPLAAALFLAAVRIYDRDYRARLLERATESAPAPPPPAPPRA